ncbi:LPS assembly lipoprotein LptE [Sphingomonas sp. 1P06PA]|uniref:LPS assembly lipoprotein LptE n=1 Tax=Sphingomonas sp. 1P06PA TaxID=554121 RepID=UPI0039A50008
MTPGRALAAALVAVSLLPGCAMRPLYAGGGDSAVVASLGRVDVAPIAGKAGWLVRNAVADRLGNPGASPQYRLEVELDDQITGFGIRTDNAVTRERRTLRARYRLVDAAQGTVLLDQTAGSDAGVDVVSSEYATIAAEETALERLAEDVATQIVTRLALYSQRTARPAR